jgi:hypothetical protein
MSVSEEVRMLIERVSTHPEEFLPKNIDFIKDVFVTRQETRWGNLIKILLSDDLKDERDVLFTKEEQRDFREMLVDLVRKRMKENIVHELVSGERDKELKTTNYQLAAELKINKTLRGFV